MSHRATQFLVESPTKQGGQVALYVREQLECFELCLAGDEEHFESLWVRIMGHTNTADTVVGVY